MDPLTIRRPSAFLPLGMSLAAMATLLVHITVSGVAREADEGAAAHVWQLLMACQVPIILFFAVRWLPQSPRQAAKMLTLQIGAAIAAIAPVYWLGL
jgi:hypothetical protein